MADLPDWMNGEARARGKMEEARIDNETTSSTASIEGLMPGGEKDDNLPGWMNADTTAPLSATLKAGSAIKPDTAAKVLSLQDKTGLPTTFISRNVQPLEEQQKQNINPDDIHPRVADYMGLDPHNAALALPDVTPLSNIARQIDLLGTYGERGAFGMERSALGFKKGIGLGSPEDDERIGQIEKRLGTDLGTDRFTPTSKALGNVVESLPQFLAAAGTGVVGATVGIPPNATMATIYGASEFGNAYLDYSKRPGVTDAEARGYAVVSGLGTAAATIALGPLMEKVPGLRMLSKEGLSSIIESPSGKAALAPLMKDIGEGAVSMGSFSGVSTLIHSAAGRLAEAKNLKEMSPTAIISLMFPKQDLIEATKATGSGFVTGGIMGGGFGAVDAFNHYQNYQHAMDVKAAYEKIGKTIESTNLYKMAPEQLVKMLKTIAPGNVYMPMEAWQTHWTKMGIDSQEAYIHAGGSPETYTQSLRTGADLPIDNAHYAYMSASEHGKALNDFVRDQPQNMNADEAGTSIKLLDEQEKADKAARERTPVDSVLDKAKEILGFKEPEKPQVADKALTDIAFTSDPAEKATLQAQYQQGMRPLFPNPKMSGMSEEQAEKYSDAIQRNSADVLDIRSKALANRKARMLGQERSDLVDQYTEQLNQDKRYRALSILQKGTMPDGSDTPMGLHGLKLNEAQVAEMMPDTPLSAFPSGIFDKNGASPDNAAEVLGFNSGAELLHRLSTMADKDTEAGRMADEEMARRHGSLAEELPRMAQEAIHNDSSLRVQMMEWRHLNSENFAVANGLVKALGRRVTPEAEIKQQARDMVGSQKTTETNPNLYLRQEALANEEAHNLLTSGDHQGAFDAKGRAILNHEMYRQAVKAQDQAQSDVRFASKFARDSVRAKLGKAGQEYLEQIDGMMDRFDFGRVSGKALERRQDLRAFVDSQRAEGYSPAIPEQLLNEANRKSWKEMTNDELHSTVDAMRNIDHLATLKNKLLKIQAGREYEQVVQENVDAMRTNFKLDPDRQPEKIVLHKSLLDKIDHLNSWFAAWRTKEEFLFRFLDGGQYHGPVWETFFNPTNKAEDFKTEKMREASESVNDIFSGYGRFERSKLRRAIYIPELEGSGLDPNISKTELMMLALHMGSEGNAQELYNGPYKLNESQVMGALSHLNPKDIETINKILKLLDSYWPMVAEQERRLNGLTPEKVGSTPFDITLKDGSVHHIDGGYFPLVYDKDISYRTSALGEADNIKDLFGTQAGRAATKHGWTNERTGGAGQAPSLDMTVFTNHIGDVIHDLAYRETVTDLYKLINDPRIRDHIQATAGKELYNRLNPWLKKVAGDRPWNPLGPLGGLTKLSSNMTAAELGLKTTSALIHSTSWFTAARELGPKYALMGLKQSANILDAYKTASQMSEFMRSRPQNFDRDIRATGTNLNIAGTSDSLMNQLKQLSPIKQAHFWSLMKGLDIGVATPTWWGAYMKAMDGGVKNIEQGNHAESVEYADQLVRDTKGSGAAKDLAPLQTAGGKLGKLFTMFYTQLNVIDNQFMEATREFKQDKDFGKLLTTASMVWFLQAPMVEALRGRTPKDDEGWGKWLMKSELMYPINMTWGLSELVRAAQTKSFEASPVFEAIGSLARTGGNIARSIPLVGDKEEWTAKDYEDAAMSIGYVTGLPTRQAFISAQYLHDWMTGEEQPDSLMEGIWRTLVGKKH